MNTEIKQLIEDAALILSIEDFQHRYDILKDDYEWLCLIGKSNGVVVAFNPLDPERGDLMKVAEAAELDIDFDEAEVFLPIRLPSSHEGFEFRRSNYQSLALAVLRAASAVLKARGE